MSRLGTGQCPICHVKTDNESVYRPFCSKRCADVDLNRWFSGVYAIPSIDQNGDENSEKTEDLYQRS